MNEVDLTEAFFRYNVKPLSHACSALTADGELVLSCSYGRFQRGDPGVLKYEEDLSGEDGLAATTLRAHLADARTRDGLRRAALPTGFRKKADSTIRGLP